MKLRITFALFSAFILCGHVHAAVVNFTSAEGYTSGAQLNSHPDWVAQTSWTSETIGDGVAREITGAFIRANYQAEAANNNVGDYFEVEATFTVLGSYSAPSFNLSTVQEWIFVLDVTEETIPNPVGRMGVALVLEDEVDPDELHLRFQGGASGSTNLGSAVLYDGHTFKLIVRYTRLDATTYSATARLDSLNDAAGEFEITDSAALPAPSFSGATSVFGLMQSGPASILSYSGIEVDQFKFAEPDIIPSTPVIVPDVVLVDAFQFKMEGTTQLQVTTNLTNAVWQVVDNSEVPGSLANPSFMDIGTASEQFYRISEVVPLFADDFEYTGNGGWSVMSGIVTAWEKGTPSLNTTFVSLNSAASGTDCWGTDLDSDYYTDTDTSLTSPIIVLPASGSLNLEWNEWIDMDSSPFPGDQGFVSIMDMDAGTNIVIHTSEGSNPVWNPVSAEIPDSALGHSIQIKFHFITDGDPSSGWGGWYIDDVKVSEQP